MKDFIGMFVEKHYEDFMKNNGFELEKSFTVFGIMGSKFLIRNNAGAILEVWPKSVKFIKNI
jgi:hypothetical protein